MLNITIAPATPLAIVMFSMVYQNAAHSRGRDGEKMRAVLEADAGVRKPEIGFVNQCRSSERVTGPFMTKVTASKPAQAVVYKRHQILGRVCIPVPP